MKTNNELQNEKQDTLGAIGIGAMIVFIALILVAAVAAAVIIQTAEKLQQNAQRTGDDTADDMAGKMMISMVVVGQTATDYEVFARLAPGSESVPATGISYQLFCGGAPEEGSLVAADVLQMSDRTATVATLAPNTGYVLVIDASGAANCDAASVGVGGTVQMYLHVDNGGTTYETLSIDSVSAGEVVV